MLIVITMMLCFFALSANMSANLMEQTKELAVLRAIGFTKLRIQMLYFYESLVLVLASCTLGIFIGVAVGYTMTLQQKLLTDSNFGFFFPTQQFLVILGTSIVCAFLSTVVPANRLMSKQIAGLMRSN